MLTSFINTFVDMPQIIQKIPVHFELDLLLFLINYLPEINLLT